VINAFGAGLALLTLGGLAEAAGWRAALHMTAALALVSLTIMVLGYRAHPNDRPATTVGAARTGA
jgi:hypothetical protein